MRFFFSTVGLHNPALAIGLPEHMALPISNEVDGGLDLDYSALLLGNEFIIDETAYEAILSGRRKFLKPMAHSLLRLRECGILTVRDMGATIMAASDRIQAKVDILLEHPKIWLEDVRGQWKQVESEFHRFHRMYGTPALRQGNTGHFGIENWLGEIGQLDNQDLRVRTQGLLNSTRKRLSAPEREQLRGILRFIITQVVCTDLLRHELDAPVLNWDDAQPYYDRLYAARWGNAQDDAAVVKQAKILFDVVIPELKPNQIDQVIKFIHDNKAVESMRKELFQIVSENGEVSNEWFTRYFNELFKSNLARQRRSRGFSWLGSAVSSVLPGAAIAQEIAIEAGLEIGAGMFGSAKARYRWYYAMQRIVENA